MNPELPFNNRVLIVDDTRSIHDDFTKVLQPKATTEQSNELDNLLNEVFDTPDSDAPQPTPGNAPPQYSIKHAFQGEEAFEKVLQAAADNAPFALIYMDVRMPPGWDGIKTIKNIREHLPETEFCICTAYSDYSWEKIVETLGASDQLHFLQKPFNSTELRQMTLSSVKKWNVASQLRHHIRHLEKRVEERTRSLQEKLDQISQLHGILPMCAYCHKVRNEKNYWQRVDEYIKKHSLAEISHGVCPECHDKLLKELDEEIDKNS